MMSTLRVYGHPFCIGSEYKFHALYMEEKRKHEVTRKWGDGFFKDINRLPKNRLSQLYGGLKNG
jgi:hypothetical protein